MEVTDLVPVVGDNGEKKAVKRRPRSGTGLAKLQGKIHTEKFPEIFTAFYDQLKKRVESGDIDALKMVADIAKLTGKGGGVNVNVVQNNQQNNVSAGRDRKFEAIVRQLEQRDHGDGRSFSEGIQDAEFEEVNARTDASKE